MIIKNKDDSQDAIDYLSDLLERDISDDKKKLIDRELNNLCSGQSAEDTAVYYLDSVFKRSKNWALIHDIRIEHDGDVAKIDHLLIGRMMDVYVIESKNFTSGVTISEEGDFSYFYKDKPYAIASPIVQNERDIKLLDKFLTVTDLLPKRLGITMQPKYRNIVLISPDAQLIKPTKGLYDCSAAMKADKFSERFKGELDKDDIYTDMDSLAKIISQETLQRVAEKLVLHHKPFAIDYRASFGLNDNQPVESPSCPVCGSTMLLREAKKGKTEGKKFWGCPQFPKCRGVVELEEVVLPEVIKTEDEPLCPKCNGAMVKRVSKQGKNIGKEFWGCKDFPKCRGAVSIEQPGADSD